MQPFPPQSHALILSRIRFQHHNEKIEAENAAGIPACLFSLRSRFYETMKQGKISRQDFGPFVPDAGNMIYSMSTEVEGHHSPTTRRSNALDKLANIA